MDDSGLDADPVEVQTSSIVSVYKAEVVVVQPQSLRDPFVKQVFGVNGESHGERDGWFYLDCHRNAN